MSSATLQKYNDHIDSFTTISSKWEWWEKKKNNNKRRRDFQWEISFCYWKKTIVKIWYLNLFNSQKLNSDLLNKLSVFFGFTSFLAACLYFIFQRTHMHHRNFVEFWNETSSSLFCWCCFFFFISKIKEEVSFLFFFLRMV